ncbi:MAG: T9SS type A sorting domain-containing protein [Crocinitomicaceae bacterium]
MKTRICLVTLIGFLSVLFPVKSQTNWCADFSVVGITPDTLNPNILQVSVSFSGSAASFANYPYISALIDCNGDTLGAGNIFWFGQFGQSTQDYPVQTNGALPCEPFTAVFIYSDNAGLSDTCILSGGSSSLGKLVPSPIHAFPNPTNHYVQIEVPERCIGSSLDLLDITGKIIYSSKIATRLISIDVEKCEKGTYVLRLLDDTGSFFTQLLIE